MKLVAARLFFLAALATNSLVSLSAQTTLDVDVAHPRAAVSPMLYGLMMEEINYSYDGGLYGELVRNRTMRGRHGTPDQWSLVEHGNVKVAWKVDPTTGPSEAVNYSVKVTVGAVAPGGSVGVANEGYWGVPVKAATTYQGSLFAKSEGDLGAMTVALIDDNTGKALASSTIDAVTSEWKRYVYTLRTGNICRGVGHSRRYTDAQSRRSSG